MLDGSGIVELRIHLGSFQNGRTVGDHTSRIGAEVGDGPVVPAQDVVAVSSSPAGISHSPAVRSVKHCAAVPNSVGCGAQVGSYGVEEGVGSVDFDGADQLPPGLFLLLEKKPSRLRVKHFHPLEVVIYKVAGIRCAPDQGLGLRVVYIGFENAAGVCPQIAVAVESLSDDMPLQHAEFRLISLKARGDESPDGAFLAERSHSIDLQSGVLSPGRILEGIDPSSSLV